MLLILCHLLDLVRKVTNMLKKHFLLIGSALVFILGQNFWSYVDSSFYFICQAFAWVMVYIYIVVTTHSLTKIIAEGILLLSISNLLDELFFNPLKVGINEYVFLLLIIVWTIIRLRKCNILKKKL